MQMISFSFKGDDRVGTSCPLQIFVNGVRFNCKIKYKNQGDVEGQRKMGVLMAGPCIYAPTDSWLCRSNKQRMSLDLLFDPTCTLVHACCL